MDDKHAASTHAHTCAHATSTHNLVLKSNWDGMFWSGFGQAMLRCLWPSLIPWHQSWRWLCSSLSIIIVLTINKQVTWNENRHPNKSYSGASQSCQLDFQISWLVKRCAQKLDSKVYITQSETHWCSVLLSLDARAHCVRPKHVCTVFGGPHLISVNHNTNGRKKQGS